MAADPVSDLTRRLAFTVREAANLLGVGRDAVYNAINRGDLRAVRFGGTLLVPRPELERILLIDELDNERHDRGSVRPMLRYEA